MPRGLRFEPCSRSTKGTRRTATPLRGLRPDCVGPPGRDRIGKADRTRDGRKPVLGGGGIPADAIFTFLPDGETRQGQKSLFSMRKQHANSLLHGAAEAHSDLVKEPPMDPAMLEASINRVLRTTSEVDAIVSDPKRFASVQLSELLVKLGTSVN